MQTLRNPLSIFRARSRSRDRSISLTASHSENEKSRNKSETTSANSKIKKATTQKLFVKRDKQASECLAETKIEKKSVCRETTHKSITITQPRMYVCAKIEKTIRMPPKVDQNSKQMSKKSTNWSYLPVSRTSIQHPSTSKSTIAAATTSATNLSLVVSTSAGKPKNGDFPTDRMIEDIFAPLRDTIQEGIKEARHNSSSPEKVKSINHTPSTRLEQWKAQLTSGVARTRDNSAPAPVQRLTIKPQSTQLNVPRAIHSTQSANNAMLIMDHRTLRDVNMRTRSGTWQPLTNSITNGDLPPIDFVTSPRISHHEANVFRPIAHRPKPADLINHNDSNKRSFRRVDSILRSDSKDSNCSLSDLLMMYQSKDSTREMNASIRSTASNSSSFPSFPPEQMNQHKNVLTTLSSSSSGIHVTPSPSDSGIIDYENLIRDKEHELQEIRQTMEQNEEIIVKVYQDKERAWKTEMEGLKCRVTAAEKGEKALREQLSNCQRQSSAVASCMRTVQDEKTRLMAKCIQLEKEIELIRKGRPFCPNCGGNQNNETREKDSDLRQEIKDLRREVSNLKKVVDDGYQFKS